jgi:polar amino acid transport system permease protein
MTAMNPHPAKAAVAAKTEKRRFNPLLDFRTRLYLTWATLFGLCVMFFMSFDLKFSIILEKWPNLVGLHLGPNGFLQGAALTLFLCFCSIWLSLLLGFVTALARLSRSAVAFGIASFYASFFRGCPVLNKVYTF